MTIRLAVLCSIFKRTHLSHWWYENIDVMKQGHLTWWCDLTLINILTGSIFWRLPLAKGSLPLRAQHPNGNGRRQTKEELHRMNLAKPCYVQNSDWLWRSQVRRKNPPSSENIPEFKITLYRQTSSEPLRHKSVLLTALYWSLMC